MSTATEQVEVAELTQWEWANDSPIWYKPRRTVYFLVRHLRDRIEYRNDKRGQADYLPNAGASYSDAK